MGCSDHVHLIPLLIWLGLSLPFYLFSVCPICFVFCLFFLFPSLFSHLTYFGKLFWISFMVPLFKDLFTYLRERKHIHTKRERDGQKQTPHWAWSTTWVLGLISRPLITTWAKHRHSPDGATQAPLGFLLFILLIY